MHSPWRHLYFERYEKRALNNFLGYGLAASRPNGEFLRNEPAKVACVLSFDEIAKVWDTHATRLLLILRAHGDLAEDAVQEAFLALARQQQLPDSPLAWLVTVARNHALQQLRSAQRRTNRQQASQQSLAWFVEDGSQKLLEAQEAVEALRQLPVADAEIVMLHVWGEMTFAQIAKVVGTSRATVHRRYAATLEVLRAKLDCQPRKMNDVQSKS